MMEEVEKGHWCGMVKSIPKKQAIYCIFAFLKHWKKQVVYHSPVIEPSDAKTAVVDMKEERVIDRALGISKAIITNASVNW